MQCKTRSGDAQKVSLSKTVPGPTAGLRHVGMMKKGVLVRRRAGGKHTQATLHRAVRRAQGSAGLHSGCHLRRCERRQGAYVWPRSWRPMLQEQELWSARGEAGAGARRGRLLEHGMASRLGPGRGRTGLKAGREEGGGGKGVSRLVYALKRAPSD